MNNRNPLRGKTALITGATGGIGAATVRLLIDYGVHVVIAARNPDKFKSLLEEVTKTAKQKVKDSLSQKQVENSLEFIKADLSSIEDIIPFASSTRSSISSRISERRSISSSFTFIYISPGGLSHHRLVGRGV